MKVLVVDNSETSLALISMSVKKLGHEVVTSNDPTQCVQLFQHIKPDCLILEIEMQPINGYQCAKLVRQVNKNEDWIPIMFMSQAIDEESITKGTDAGGDLYLPEPFSEKQLAVKVQMMQKITDIRKRSETITQRLTQANNRLNQLSLTDDLTGIANRRAFEISYSREWKRTARLSGKFAFLSVLMIDIDHFKRFNDRYGHQKGDQCLQKVASVLNSLLPRENDELFRYGGEEFVVILPVTDRENALKIAERLRHGVEISMRDNHVTISVGVATTEVAQDSNKENFLQIVDKALYVAKTKGRNQVVFRECVSNH